jgi:hypothetical protein
LFLGLGRFWGLEFVVPLHPVALDVLFQKHSCQLPQVSRHLLGGDYLYQRGAEAGLHILCD